MNSDWSDKILDSFLEEVVTDRHPPDLRARILAAWQQEQAGQIPLPERTDATGELIAPPVVAKLPPTQKSTVALPTKSRTSYGWQVLLVVAASGLLIACAVQWRSVFMQTSDSIANAIPSNNSADSVSKETQPAFANNSKPPRKENRFNGEKLGTENVPFASTESVKPSAEELKSNAVATASQLSDKQIVELIDTQLGMLWQRLKVTPQAKLDTLARAQLVSKTLTGQDLPSPIAAELAEAKSGERRDQTIAQMVSQAVDSQAFARLWAKELVADWLRGGNLPLNSPSVEQLEQQVASGIANDSPWNEVVSKVVADDVWVTAFAGGGNHQMAAHLSGAFMDSSLGCVRCHEPKGSNAIAKSQEQYWSLVAMLLGLDVRNDEKTNTRAAVDKQAEVFADTKKPSLFFDRPDGTLVAAKFVLPDGEPWQNVADAKTPREALAKWIGESSQSDEAIVNRVWQLSLGRPLIASNALVDDVGLTERSELQQLLAQQFRAHGRNLSQLVGWIVSSDAFLRDSIAVDQSRWLQASESEIDNWHLAEMTFAARTSLGERAVKGGLENSLAATVKWNQANSERGGAVLAQPSLDPKLKAKSPVKSDVVMPAPGYAIHRGRLSQDQQSYVTTLAASEKLTWEQKVDHIVALSPTLTASGGVKRLSEDLLKALGDPKAALTELMWAVQNADAS